jgi:branched-subunit amino acid transport protein
MSRELTIWLLVFAVGAITYTARVSFIALFARRSMPSLLARALRHVPAAMLTAIVVPAIVFSAPGVLDLSPGNIKLIAAVVAAGVAWWRQSTVLTMAAGMAALWLLQYLVG